MKRWQVWCCAAVAMAMSAAVAWAEPAAEKPAEKPARAAKPEAEKPQTPALMGAHAIMARECKLSEAQTAELAQRAEAVRAQLKAWDEAHKDKLADLRKQEAEARAAGKKEDADKLRTEIRQITDARKKIEDDGRASVTDVLTPEQKLTWAGYNLYTGQLQRLNKVKLTDEQKAQIRPLCDAAAKDIAATEDAKAKGAIRTKLIETVDSVVLTDEQREAMKKPAAPAPKKD